MQPLAFSLTAIGLSALLLNAQEPPVHVDLASGHNTKPDIVRDQQLADGSAAYQAFLQSAGGHWVSRWNYATETPKAIYGTGLRLPDWRGDSQDEARRQALALLDRHRILLGTDTSTLREVIAAKARRVHVFVFDQYFRGLPVIDGRADVRINDAGIVAMFGSMAFRIPAGFPTVPTLSAEQARLIAFDALGQVPTGAPKLEALPGDPDRLVIWGDINSRVRAPIHLAWEVKINTLVAGGEGLVGRYYVDAATGQPLRYVSDKHECGLAGCTHAHHGDLVGKDGPLPTAPAPIDGNVMGYANLTTTATGGLTNTPLRNLRISVPGVGTVYTDANGDFSVNSSLTNPLNVAVTLVGRHISSISGSSAPTQTLSITPGTPASFQLLTSGANEFQRAHTNTYWWVDDVNEWTRSIVGNSSQMNTISGIRATVNINENCNAFYTNNTINFYTSGGGCSNTAFSTVITHEWGHGLDAVYGGISQTNGLSEAWGDTVAMYHSNQPIVGSGFSSGGYVRTGTNTRTYPNGSSVHQQGESFMGFNWDLRTRLTATQGSANAISISNDIVIGSIPADATNQPDAVREIFIIDDDDGNLLNGVPHYAELEYAALRRNLPYPERQLATIQHTGLASTEEQLTPRLINAVVTPITGTITAVRLSSRIGTTTTTRAMTPSATTGSYMGLIPGARSPETVSYHIEVDHSTNTTLRLPKTGEFTYSVGLEEVFFSDDFEGGTNGWTSVQVATQNDWQFGGPTGKTGSSSGVSWTDPSAAASGTACRGNDLGIGNYNGAYQPNVHNYLLSPTLNLTGKLGVKLRFRRWLTVEEGIYDQATINVNNVRQWANPLNGNLLDTSWSQQEVPLPAADNNPAMRLDFRLQTDGGLQLGGWAIDDVELFSFTALPALDLELEILPEQVQIGAALTLTAKGSPNAPVLVALGNTAGPTTISGIPTLQVGGATVTFPAFLDGSGDLTFAFTAPASPGAVGTFWYTQALSLDASLNIVASNANLTLFTQ